MQKRRGQVDGSAASVRIGGADARAARRVTGRRRKPQLKRRTLTNLYNARPAWLAHLHRDLDAAVFAAYGWPEAGELDALGDEDLLGRLLALNLARA